MNKITKKSLLIILFLLLVVLIFIPNKVFARTIIPPEASTGALNLTLSSEGILSWDNDDSSSYTVRIIHHLDDQEIYSTSRGINNIDIIGHMDSSKLDTDTYRFQVVSSSRTDEIVYNYVSPYEMTNTPTNLRWDGNIARWDAAAGATGYELYLYNASGDQIAHEPLGSIHTSCDFSSKSPSNGWYFTIYANKTGNRNSPEVESPLYGNTRVIVPTVSTKINGLNLALSSEGILSWDNDGSSNYTIKIINHLTGIEENSLGTSTNSYDIIHNFMDVGKRKTGWYRFAVISSSHTDEIIYHFVSPHPMLNTPTNLRWEGMVAKWDAAADVGSYDFTLYDTAGNQVMHTELGSIHTEEDVSSFDPENGWYFTIYSRKTGYYRYSPEVESPLLVKAPTTYHVGADPYNATTSSYYTGGKVKVVTTAGSGDYEHIGYGYEVDANSQVTIYAQADTNYEFVEWRIGSETGTLYSTNATLTFNATQTIYLVAIFQEQTPPEPTYNVTYDFNGGNRHGESTYVTTSVGFVPVISVENFIDWMQVTAPTGKELDAIEINGVRYELGSYYELNKDTTYKYLWKDISKPHSHTYKTIITKATLNNNGSIIEKCTECGDVKSSIVIPKINDVTLSKTSFTYNKKVQKPSVTIKDRTGKVLKDGTDYTLSYSNKNSKKVGEYKVTVTFKGDYSGSKTLTYQITPKGTKLSKVTKGKKQFKVTWKKQTTETSGYQLQYSTSKNFSSGNKTITIKKNKTTSSTAKKLKAKKKYYVRIRTYKTVNGKKIYSGWSASKSVKIK